MSLLSIWPGKYSVMSEVFRVEKTRDFTVMSNRHLRDSRLSLKGKGLLSLILSLPDNWEYSVKGFSKLGPDGQDSIIRKKIDSFISEGYQACIRQT